LHGYKSCEARSRMVDGPGSNWALALDRSYARKT
jgi:hypothetical protein